jgi:hypothetical protein
MHSSTISEKVLCYLRINVNNVPSRIVFVNRVTRLGEFSPRSSVGQLFTLSSTYSDNFRSFLDYFIPQKNHAVMLTKTGMGNILADFFTNSTGHPVR